MAADPTLPVPPVVLVVDDEAIILQMMARALLEAGYAVHMAGSGPEALALAEELPQPFSPQRLVEVVSQLLV